MPSAACGGRQVAGLVARRRLDLDHVGAEVAERHRRQRPGEHPGEVGDEDTVERRIVATRRASPWAPRTAAMSRDPYDPEGVRRIDAIIAAVTAWRRWRAAGPMSRRRPRPPAWRRPSAYIAALADAPGAVRLGR